LIKNVKYVINNKFKILNIASTILMNGQTPNPERRTPNAKRQTPNAKPRTRTPHIEVDDVLRASKQDFWKKCRLF